MNCHGHWNAFDSSHELQYVLLLQASKEKPQNEKQKTTIGQPLFVSMKLHSDLIDPLHLSVLTLF